MNCLDFRRTLLAEPSSQAPDFVAHRHACVQCARMAARAALLEQHLGRAFEVDVPEKLSARVLLKQLFDTPPRRRTGRTWPYAMAASVILGVGLALGLMFQVPNPSLEEAVFTHVAAHPRHQHWGKPPVSRDTLATLLKPMGARITGDVGTVTGASICAIRERLAAHLVLAGDKAPVAVLLMPEERVKGRFTVSRDDAVGLLAPAPMGTLAVVGAVGEPLEEVEARVRSALRWEL